MRRIITLLTLALLLAPLSHSAFTANAQDEDPLLVMTFNMRVDVKSDGLNQWDARKDSVGIFLQNIGPDLIGAQEVLKHQLDDLLERLPGYRYVGVGRADGKEAGEYAPILYRTDRVELVESGHFWLSETPTVPGSKGWDAACERVATWAIFKDKENGKLFYMLNTHLDHKGALARENSVEMIRREAQKYFGKYPVVVTGDFNLPPTSEVMEKLTDPTEPGFLFDSYLWSFMGSEGEEWTYHGFGTVPMEKRQRLDYILVQGDWAFTSSYTAYTEEEYPDRVYLSDHTPVSLFLIWKK